MDYSMFVMPVHDPAKPLAQCYDEDLELAVQCEETGFTDFWVGEHHSSTVENIVMPEVFLAKVLGMTRTIRVGAAPVCLPYHHPVHVASRLAFLDHLSHGRLNVCFGPGAIPTDLEVYGIDPTETGAYVAEAIVMILKIWTTDPPYELHGKYWNICLQKTIDLEMGMGTLHKPLQQPYPPIFVPSINRASRGLHAAAARGFHPISHHMIHTNVLIDQWRTYEAGAESAGRTASPGDWCVSRNIFVADSTKEARQLARTNSLGACIEYIIELTRRTSPTGLSMWKRDDKMDDDECNLDYFMDQVIIAGDPDTVTAKLLELREQIGAFGTLVLVAHDWDDRNHWMRSLDLFAKEVVPAFNQSVGAMG
ncbi:MAG: hypothetical protein CMJ21_07095 [Phycisphaerae bacterium]|nr:hypothetical protein [Phycisphaerae bacterium]